MTNQPDVRDLIERGSLGTPEAKALRATVTDEQVARVLARAKELAQEHREQKIDAVARLLNGDDRSDRAVAWLLATRIVDVVLGETSVA